MVSRDPRDGAVYYLDRAWSQPRNHLYLLGNVRRLNQAPDLAFENFTLYGTSDTHEIDTDLGHALDQEYMFDPPERRGQIIKSALNGHFARLLAGMDTEAHALRMFHEINNRAIFNILPDTEDLMVG